MPLEVATYISGLNSSNPVGSTDKVQTLDDHVRLVKSTLLNTFPNITGAMTASHSELNNLAGVTGKTGTGNVVLSASPTFTGTVGAAAITATGTITGNLFSGSGASLTALVAANITAGGTLPALNGSALTSLNGTNIASGTVADARLSGNVPLLNAANTFTVAQAISVSGAAHLDVTASGTNSAYVKFTTNSATRGYVGDHTLITGATTGDMVLRAESGGIAFTGNGGTSAMFRLSSAGVVTTPTASASEVGYQGLPTTVINNNYTFVLADANTQVNQGTASKVVTIPQNSGGVSPVAFPVGTLLSVMASVATQVAITTDTLYLAGAGLAVTGTRTVAAGGIFFAHKLASTTWMCWGPGVS
jgi:hypothetical protein